MEAVTIKNLTFTYPNAADAALKDINLQIDAGEFVVLAGRSGCGKTTLLKQLKPSLTPRGTTTGSIQIDGMKIKDIDRRTEAKTVGYVLQDPEMQICTDKVFRELAFGMESLGFSPQKMQLRAAEMASYFGISDWFERPTAQLSGGQKQILNLASVMAMQPKLLVLDEPTAQLDPIGARAFLELLLRINRELGTTIVLADHRLDSMLHMATKIVFMQDGCIHAQGAPREVLENLEKENLLLMPEAAQLYYALGGTGACPLTTSEGKRWLEQTYQRPQTDRVEIETRQPQLRVLSVRDVWFRYEKNGADVLKGASVEIAPGEVFALLGDNGSGKSTLLSLLCGARKPLRGKIKCSAKKVCMVPQNPQLLFSKDSVREELSEVCKDEARVLEMADKLGLSHLLTQNPHDLSGGEMQRTAIAKALLLEPDLLLLDEPSKGLDTENRNRLGVIIRSLGITVVLVSHDMQFCAACADRCALMFNGNVLAAAEPHAFFAANEFYTTAARKMSARILDNAITVTEVASLCSAEQS